MVDPSIKGYQFKPVVGTVEGGRLRAFFRSIGETNPAVTGPDTSGRVAIPPTYLFCLEMLDADDPFGFVNEIGVGIDEILHANQSFTYHHPIYVGDTVTFRAKVGDIFEKKGGALIFVVQDVEISNQDEKLVAEIQRTFVIRKEIVA